MSFEATAAAPSLTANDLHASVAWYRDVIGFTVEREHARDGVPFAVSLRAGDVAVLLTQDDGRRGDRVKGEGFSLQFTTTQDVDAIAARVTAAGGTLDTPPSDTPWGARVFRVRDPDGFRLVFSTPRTP